MEYRKPPVRLSEAYLSSQAMQLLFLSFLKYLESSLPVPAFSHRYVRTVPCTRPHPASGNRLVWHCQENFPPRYHRLLFPESMQPGLRRRKPSGRGKRRFPGSGSLRETEDEFFQNRQACGILLPFCPVGRIRRSEQLLYRNIWHLHFLHLRGRIPLDLTFPYHLQRYLRHSSQIPCRKVHGQSSNVPVRQMCQNSDILHKFLLYIPPCKHRRCYG